MLKNSIFLVAIVIFASGSMMSQGIEFFHGTWKEALAKAKDEDKLVFVDAYAKWCGPCKAMAKNVFTQQSVGEFYNANFINLKLDMEESDGVTFGHKYPVSAYPSLFFLDGEGKVIKKIKGGQRVEGLLALGEEALKSNDKSGKYQEKYDEGDRSYELVYSYVKALNAVGKPSLKISNDYLNSNPAITEDQNLKFTLEAAMDSDSKLFDKVIENKSKLIQLVGKETYEQKCIAACQYTITKAIDFEMESLMTDAITKAKKTFPDYADIFAAKSGMQFYKTFKNLDKYKSSYRSLVKKSGKDIKELQFIIKDIGSTFKDNKEMLADGTEYAERVFDEKQDMESLNTYCGMLILTDNIDKAIKEVQKQKEKVEKEGGELSGYEGLLNYLNTKKA